MSDGIRCADAAAGGIDPQQQGLVVAVVDHRLELRPKPVNGLTVNRSLNIYDGNLLVAVSADEGFGLDLRFNNSRCQKSNNDQQKHGVHHY